MFIFTKTVSNFRALVTLILTHLYFEIHLLWICLLLQQRDFK